jgi:hypothetical protein
MNERDSFLGEASFGKEGSFVGSNPSGHVEILELNLSSSAISSFLLLLATALP